ncbi:MAG: GNAT family N-acetyltransferase [Candidatus Thermoplasmatota archaeon]
MELSDWLECPHLAAVRARVPGLSFRRLRGPSEAAAMSRTSRLSWEADGVEWMVRPEEVQEWLEDRSDHDHMSDVLVIEGDGEFVGYSELVWDSVDADPKYLRHSVFLLPGWRGRGIREAVFDSNESRLREIASALPTSGRCYFRLWANDVPNEWKAKVESSGYTPSWHLLEMERKGLQSIDDVPAPEGLDYGPVRPEEYPAIWALFRDCFSQEQWSSTERWSEDVYREWLSSPKFTPEHWRVARAGGGVVGVVENSVDMGEWSALGRKVAHSERVCVREGWRRKGITTYLMTSSLKHLRDIGVEEVSLDTEVENKSRAMRVYQKVGFATRRTFTFYAKPV